MAWLKINLVRRQLTSRTKKNSNKTFLNAWYTKFHIYSLKVSANIKIAMQCLKVSGGANTPNAIPLVARLVANMGRGTKWVENHWPRRFSQNNDWRLDPLPTLLLHSVKLLKIHIWVAAKQETVIEGINIINSSASKIFQAHVFTRTGGIIWKTIGKKNLTSLAYLIGDCGWTALITHFWVASAGIF